MCIRDSLNILYVISWIIFIGVCIEAGGFLFNTFYTMVLNPGEARFYWAEVDLSSLYKYDSGYFLLITMLMSIVAILKALLFYVIVKIIYEKKLDLSKPFNREMGRFIFNVSYLALGLGIFAYSGVSYTAWLVTQNVEMPDIQHMGLGGADVWLFMGVTLYVLAQIFKRGIEIQEENDLTV